jgi:hypothetical protein
MRQARLRVSDMWTVFHMLPRRRLAPAETECYVTIRYVATAVKTCHAERLESYYSFSCLVPFPQCPSTDHVLLEP